MFFGFNKDKFELHWTGKSQIGWLESSSASWSLKWDFYRTSRLRKYTFARNMLVRAFVDNVVTCSSNELKKKEDTKCVCFIHEIHNCCVIQFLKNYTLPFTYYVKQNSIIFWKSSKWRLHFVRVPRGKPGFSTISREEHPAGPDARTFQIKCPDMPRFSARFRTENAVNNWFEIHRCGQIHKSIFSNDDQLIVKKRNSCIFDTNIEWIVQKFEFQKFTLEFPSFDFFALFHLYIRKLTNIHSQ